MVDLHQGDCLDVMRGMAESSVDAIVCDPPYGLSFMGKTWDKFQASDMPMRGRPELDAVNAGMSRQGGRQRASADYQKRQARDMREFQAWCESWAIECLRVLKPGGYMLAFGGTRTYHRLVTGVEDAGFEIRDQIGWAFGSGFPKSHNGEWGGTALKPAWEPICMARKPLIGTVEANWQEHGTGALNIDGCRVLAVDEQRAPITGKGGMPARHSVDAPRDAGAISQPHDLGRWPANLILDGSDEVIAAFPNAPGQLADASTNSEQRKTSNTYGAMRRGRGEEASADSANEGAVGFNMRPGARRLDSGSAARFFKVCQFSEDDQWPPKSNAQPARSAESPSNSCATPTAAGVAETKTSASRSEESPATQACTGSCESSTQPQCPASAERQESIGTTTTTASCSKSSGFAHHATAENTNSESKEAAGVDSGLAQGTRFHYCPKAGRADRNDGCEDLQRKPLNWSSGTQNPGSFQAEGTDRSSPNNHPTVKPTDLMRYLCRLVTPKGGLILDPFMGSGSTGRGAVLEGFRFVGIEREADYMEIARLRIDSARRQGHQPGLELVA